jgi:hypothetical protein
MLQAAGSRDFSLLHSVQTCSGAYQASDTVGTRGFVPSSKAVGHEANHSPPSSAEVKNGVKLTTHLLLVLRSRMVSYTSTPPYIFMVWCLINSGATTPFT